MLSSVAPGNNEQRSWGQGHHLDDLPSGAGLCFLLDDDLYLFYSVLLWSLVLVPSVWSRNWSLNPLTHSPSFWGSFQGMCTYNEQGPHEKHITSISSSHPTWQRPSNQPRCPQPPACKASLLELSWTCHVPST